MTCLQLAAFGGAERAEPDLGARFHERQLVPGPAFPDTQHTG
jgi:hypothetical protein